MKSYPAPGVHPSMQNGVQRPRLAELGSDGDNCAYPSAVCPEWWLVPLACPDGLCALPGTPRPSQLSLVSCSGLQPTGAYAWCGPSFDLDFGSCSLNPKPLASNFELVISQPSFLTCAMGIKFPKPV